MAGRLLGKILTLVINDEVRRKSTQGIGFVAKLLAQTYFKALPRAKT
jgi:hypothetical protein